MIDISIYAEDVSNIGRILEIVVNSLKTPSISLDEIKDDIFEEICRDKESKLKDENEAMNIACNIIFHIAGQLDVNEINFNRLKQFVTEWCCFEAYENLICNYKKYMTTEERNNYIQQCERMFPNILEID